MKKIAKTPAKKLKPLDAKAMNTNPDPMDGLTQSIIRYLNSETAYAVVLSGDYGVGKTFAFKNVLQKAIVETKCPHDDTRKFKTVYVSLFGIKSLEDIEAQILLQFYSIAKAEKLKFALASVDCYSNLEVA